MNIIAVFVLTVGINTWGTLLFNFETIPVIFLQLEKNYSLIGSVTDPVTPLLNATTPLL